MTENYIRHLVRKTLSNYCGEPYWNWDDIFIHKAKNLCLVSFNIFNPYDVPRVERFLRGRHIAFTTTNGCRGGYLGGGNYREFTSFNIKYNF